MNRDGFLFHITTPLSNVVENIKGSLYIFKGQIVSGLKFRVFIIHRYFLFVKIIHNSKMLAEPLWILYIPEIMFEFLEKTVTNDEE